ncbi:hypothetical protein [Thiohalophilus sp.]|uniref:hypothetical protein n=1 Tax=Thiohalophilus sp. TaxID=3028392 RepID=UPI002ACE7DEC|nr:hypothetical protein [Thiohalophilus sp.]MDZ7661130.1 hypothetical protein [Thiohalophilus sp.]
MVLILVDGQSDINQLHNKAVGVDGLEQALERLALDGFIEANNKAWQPLDVIPEQTDELESDGSFDARAVKAKLVDAAILVLGNDAGKITKMLHEAPDTPDGIEAAILRCKKMVDLTIDEGRSAELKQKCLEIIGKM